MKAESKIQRIKQVAIYGDLTQIETKVFFALLDEEKTQAMLARDICMPLVSIKKAVKQLTERSLLIETKTEGRNKFLTANLPEEIQDKHQMRI